MAQDTKRKKVLAVLAGGLVLGVGAAVTLAAWTDSEFATGTFTAGSFNLEGSTTSATDGYIDHATAAGAAALEFTLDTSNMSPGDVVAAPFWVRLSSGTTSPATLTAAAPAVEGDNAANLAYTVRAIEATDTCDVGSRTAGVEVVGGASLEIAAPGAAVALAEGAAGVAGDAEQLCFIVEAGSDLAQGVTTSATWSFTAESTE